MREKMIKNLEMFEFKCDDRNPNVMGNARLFIATQDDLTVRLEIKGKDFYGNLVSISDVWIPLDTWETNKNLLLAIKKG
jgi:hypothetical protein